LRIEVRLFADLVRFLPPGSRQNPATLEIERGVTVDDVLNRLGIPSNITNIVMVNGVHGDRAIPLNEGDVVSVFLPLAGG